MSVAGTPKMSPAAERARVLVVEDDALVLSDAGRALEELGHQVVGTARTGEEAIEVARERRPDLALMDIRLAGETDGIQAGQILREELGVPVVYLTAYADEATRRRVRATAPYGYVVKPYDDRDLQTAVEVALLRHRLESRVERERARLAERVKEQACLYDVSRTLHEADRPLDRRLRGVVDRIPDGWQHPGVTEVRLRLDETILETDAFPADGPTLRSSVEMEGQHQGRIEVRYREERPAEDLGPFLEEERRLLDQIAERIGVELGRTEARRRAERLADILESTSDFVGTAAEDGSTLWVNRPGRRMLGIPGDEDLTGVPLAAYYPDWAIEKVLGEGLPAARRDGVWEDETALLTRDGEQIPVSQVILSHRDEDGEIAYFSTIARDISERERARKESEEQRRTLTRILDTTAEGILLTDAEGDFRYANPAAERILGLERSEIAARTYREPSWNICAPDGGPFPDEQLPVARVLRTGEPVTAVEHGVERPDGTRIVLSVNAAPLTGPDGELTGVVASIRDVTEQKKFEDQLQRRALHDYLTGLPNRALFRDRLQHALERSARSGERLAVCFLDLRRFKVVNDSLGHEAGDRVLQEVARRLADAVRDEDTVARIGGDEFTVLLEGVEGEEDVEETVRRITAAFEAPIRIGEDEVPMDASMGVAVHAPEPGDGLEASDLVRCADAAMYRAREQPGTRHHVARAGDTAPRGVRLEREARLRHALKADQIRTVYQPLYETASGRMVGVEALARWTDEELGEVPPGVFIPLAEETGQIVRLGEQQLLHACRELQAEELSVPGKGGPFRLHVNLSARQLEDPDVVSRVRDVLDRTSFPPERLCLEITESAAMRQPEVVDRLKEIGVSLALDDFGTRYSTLSQLRRLRTDALKIDRTFVDGMLRDERDRAIVETILTLGRSLGLTVVAEGVESESQLEMLRELGCDEAQGFHLARPGTTEELGSLVDGLRQAGRGG